MVHASFTLRVRWKARALMPGCVMAARSPAGQMARCLSPVVPSAEGVVLRQGEMEQAQALAGIVLRTVHAHLRPAHTRAPTGFAPHGRPMIGYADLQRPLQTSAANQTDVKT